MRALSLATVMIGFAVAACSDVAAPIGAGPDAPSLMVMSRGAPHVFRGKGIDARGKRGHDNDDQQSCADDDDDQGKGGHHDHHYSGSRDRHHYQWGKRGHNDYRRGKRGHGDHHRGKRGHDDGDRENENEDCSGGDGGGGGEDTTSATISGTVMGNSVGLNSYPVFLLDPGGTAVVATTATTTDGTGSYTFAGVKPGAYLVCEDYPFTEAHGFLGETQPSTGAPCPSGYAARGFSVTVAAGATAGGNNFANFGLE